MCFLIASGMGISFRADFCGRMKRASKIPFPTTTGSQRCTHSQRHLSEGCQSVLGAVPIKSFEKHVISALQIHHRFRLMIQRLAAKGYWEGFGTER